MHICSHGCFGALSRRGFMVCAAAALPATALAASAQGLEQDVRLGAAEYPKLIAAMGGGYTHDGAQKYVTDVGLRLAANSEAPQLPFEFTVLNTPTVNAWALPGGKIGITRGLLALAASEAELAGVMAHEIGHVIARHGARGQKRSTLANLGLAVLGLATKSNDVLQLGQTLTAGFLQHYSRDQEYEADTLGVRYLTRSGYDPAAMAGFLASLREHSQLEARMLGLPEGEVDRLNFMASHPRTVERVRAAEKAAAAIAVQNPLVRRAEYLGAINGILFGDDPAQGFVRDRRFLHTGLGIAFEVPERFVLRNSADRVMAEDGRGASIVFDMGAMQRARDPAEYLQYEWLAQVPLAELERFQVGGMPAATGSARVSSGSSVVDIRAAVIEDARRQAFRFLFVSPPRQTAALARGVRETLFSFRRLTDEDRSQARPLRLITVDVGRGDTLESLARTLPFGRFNADWFRLLNDIGPGQDVTPGQAVKIVLS